jgi:hypothetical protein
MHRKGENHPFFERVDWTSFGVTFLLSLAVYLFLLIPENDLEFSGIYATSALHGGVSNPPAYPVWTLYSWLFVRLLPFSNIAWRVAVATAVASALTCGLIALMVSRAGFLAVGNISGFKALSINEQKSFRIVCGCVAGLGLGLDGCFWKKAEVADQWNFNVCLFALELCLLTRWFFAPQQKRYLYSAALVQGLILADSQALFPTAFALPFLVALGNPKIGREIFFLFSVLFTGVLVTNPYTHWFDDWMNYTTRFCEIAATVLVVAAWVFLLILTRGFMSEWKATLFCVILFFVGVSACLLLPVFSMTDPPVNWGYPRTVAGFFHVLARGQYGAPDDVQSIRGLLAAWPIYAKIAIDNFGIAYLVAAAIPFFLLHKISPLARKWIIGLLIVWFLVSTLMLIGLNPGWDKAGMDLDAPFFAATHLVLAVLAGCGLMLIAAFCAKPGARSKSVGVVGNN